MELSYPGITSSKLGSMSLGFGNSGKLNVNPTPVCWEVEPPVADDC